MVLRESGYERLTARLHYVAVPVGSLQFDPGSEGVVSVQRDLKPESLRISSICSHFDQHMRGNQSRVPNGFDLVVRLRLHQERDRSSSMGVIGPVWSGSVVCGSRLHYEITRTVSNRFNPEH